VSYIVGKIKLSFSTKWMYPSINKISQQWYDDKTQQSQQSLLALVRNWIKMSTMHLFKTPTSVT